MVEYESEAKLENNLIQKLMKVGYQKVNVSDINTLENHFRQKLNQ